MANESIGASEEVIHLVGGPNTIQCQEFDCAEQSIPQQVLCQEHLEEWQEGN